MMKKIFAAVMVCAMLIASAAFAEAHECNNRQYVDIEKHWLQCLDCGAVTYEGAHEVNEESICDICGAEVYDFMGDRSVFLYDDEFRTLMIGFYDEEGAPIDEILFFHETDADGNLIKTSEYYNAVLTRVQEYVVVDGVTVSSFSTNYFDDGSYYTTEYDENVNPTRCVNYSAEGYVYSTEEYEYVLTEDGFWSVSKSTVIYDDGSKIINEYDEFGNNTGYIYYNADGSVYCEGVFEIGVSAHGYPHVIKSTYSYEDGMKYVYVNDEYDNNILSESYDAYGDLIYKEENEYMLVDEGYWMLSKSTTVYADGLTYVSEYNESGYCSYYVCYNPDGSINAERTTEFGVDAYGILYLASDTTVYENGCVEVNKYNERGYFTAAIVYAPDGTVESEAIWEYTYSEQGDLTYEKYYENGVLYSETEYAYAAGGAYTFAETVTEYYDDGSKRVTVWDEDYNIVSETTYDADGNITE